MENFMNKLKTTKILGIVGYAIVIVSLFLPLITVSVFGMSQSVTYIEGDGIFVLILAVIGLVMIFADKLAEKVPFFSKLVNPKLTSIPTAIIAALLLFLTFNSSKLGALGSVAKFSIGFYLLWVGTIVSAVYPFLYKGNDTTTTK